MTHDELLARIENELKAAEFDAQCNSGGQEEAVKALRAVVELHEPYGEVMCVICEGLSYPCPTIQAIEKELA